MLTDAIRPAILLGAVSGIALHAALAVAFHNMCHKSEEIVMRWRPLRLDSVSTMLARIRRFHDAHHIGPGNYSLIIPLVDIVGRSTAESPSDPTHIENELFPGFCR
jgi:hypothetical protein